MIFLSSLQTYSIKQIINKRQINIDILFTSLLTFTLSKQLSQFKTLILSEIYQVSPGYSDRFFALKWGYINDARITGLLI